jgi:hypothetical protein
VEINGVLISPITPNLHNWLFEKLERSKVWESLNYKTQFDVDRSGKSSFSITLVDMLFDAAIFDDMLLSPYEQEKLNLLVLKPINQINLRVEIDTLTCFQYQLNEGYLLSDLNFILFMLYAELEIRFPLVFSYVARSTFSASKEYIPSIVSCCLKSNETSVLEQRSIISGILKSLRNCSPYVQYVSSMDRGKAKRLSHDPDTFVINWFVPAE